VAALRPFDPRQIPRAVHFLSDLPARDGYDIFVIAAIGKWGCIHTRGKGWVELKTNAADDRDRPNCIINIITVNCYEMHNNIICILWLSGLQVGGTRRVCRNTSVNRSVPLYRYRKGHTSTILHYTKRIRHDGRLRARGAW